MEFSTQVKIATDPIYQKVSKSIPEIEWATHAPFIYKINKCNAVIVLATEYFIYFLF